ncbi:hypothetical protein BGZ99_003869 [Dissophora globulifera]|uniref:Uncharacterized protein n=1 Tax=Dissophora globulifera TaxID=979702 RepID=A0A9P6RJ92_9FUNG|nr:hypothetical protein BGZ99_003869 [Dissophora globulifera]
MTIDQGARNNEILIEACKDDNLDMLEQVLSTDNYIDINHTDGLGNSALHYAVKYASIGCLEIFLYYDGINVNAINDVEGDTPLHKAAAHADPEAALDMVQILVGKGASMKIQNKLNQTPLDVVPSGTHAEVKSWMETAALSAKTGSA